MSDFSGPSLDEVIASFATEEDEETPLGGAAVDEFESFGPFTPSGPYMPGAETGPLGWSPEAVSDLQKRLAKGGWLNPSNVVSWGTYDTSTQNAFKDVLVQSNRTGTHYAQTMRSSAKELAKLRSRAMSGGGGGGGGGGRAPSIRLTNPDDLRDTFRQVARSQTGGVWVEDDQIEAMVKAYHAEETRAQQAAAAGGTFVSQASPQTFGAEQLEEVDQGGAMASRFAQMASVLEELAGA